MNPISLYLRLVRIAIKARMQYRADFVTGILGVIVMNVVNISLIGILVSRFADLNGWTIWEVVFLYSLWILGHSLFSLFMWHIRTLEDYLVQGTFDQFLLRPASAFVLFTLNGSRARWMTSTTSGAANPYPTRKPARP